MIKINKKESKTYFNEVFIPEIFTKMYLSKILKNKDSKIFDYIKTNYKLSLVDLIKSLEKLKLIVSNTNNKILIKLDNNIKLNDNLKLETLINLIDYGCLGNPGLHIFDSTINDINKNWLTFRFMYYLKGGN